MSAAPLLKVDGLNAFYGSSQALFDCAIQVGAGGFVAVLGANGAGKTTLLRAICGMVRRQGRILLEGVDIGNAGTEKIASRGVAHVPDGRGTFSGFSVRDNLRLGAHTRSDRAAIAIDLDRVCTYFPRLKERWHQQAGSLSGGEQQMVAIGRALMLRPKLLLMDEPSFGLAPLFVQEIFHIMTTVNTQEGTGILLVEQNANLALKAARYAYVLETGRVVHSGPAHIVAEDAMVQRSYLGV